MPSLDDADVKALVTGVLDEAWKKTRVAAPVGTAIGRGPVSLFMALKVMAAVRDGERNAKRLRVVALRAFEQANEQ